LEIDIVEKCDVVVDSDVFFVDIVVGGIVAVVDGGTFQSGI
jgi:hypothetical protein